MKWPIFIAFIVCAARVGLLLSPAHAETHFEGHVLSLAAPKAAAPATGASAAHEAAPRSTTHASPHAATSVTKHAHPTTKRRAASIASATRLRVVMEANTPFEFRGIPLGITLTALRDANMVRATPHDSELICETDIAGGDIGMTVKADTSLAIACRWAHRTAQGWALSRAVVDAAPASDHVLRFTHASPGEPLRLYEMSFVVDDMTALDIRNLFGSRYGAPRVLGEPSLPMLEWDNAMSTIRICWQPESHNATLTYLLKLEVPRAKANRKSLMISGFDAG